MPFYRELHILPGVRPDDERRVLDFIGRERFDRAVAAFRGTPVEPAAGEQEHTEGRPAPPEDQP